MTQLKRMMFSSVELFCLVAEYESFSKAALHAGVSPAAVSRSIARLEKRLTTPLFIRTTRQVRLTPQGKTYFAECKQALNQILEAEQHLKNQNQQPTGLIRLSVPTPYGHYRILPLLAKFTQQYPSIEIDIQLTNKNVDFIAEGFDLAIRGRQFADSNLIVRKLEQAELIVVASPQYLRQFGTPQQLEDLLHHQCIQFVLPSSGKNVPWLFNINHQTIEYMTNAKLRCLDDILGTVTLAKHDAGLLQTYRFIVEKELESGELIEVLTAFSGTSRPFSLLYPSKKHESFHIRVFIDFLIEALKP
ncbi:LysR family transcriptional regulator [Acinetobacter venetianus]|uniref:LysR family transcriptional regulator n=1 Tax=Acinetobacter venetianus TaxID=52133 RepID=UPI0007784284|nr:LysR family transcriptional regulator [Acinetobacter venetianus]KXZ63661.1 HTH-type transcriptional regulator DmlR [Acinetobacter venetianus]